MARRRKVARCVKPKSVLRFPDLEHSKIAILNSLPAASSQDSDGHAIDEFIGWYCSEPRLAFNRTVVLRYRFFLEQKGLAPSTINVRLAAVPRLAYEASDTGLLSPDLTAGIHRVKGAKRLGVSIGDWLTIDQSKTLLQRSPTEGLREKRDRAALASSTLTRMWSEASGACRAQKRGSSDSGRPLGNRGSGRKREAHSYGSGADVG